MLTLGYFCAAGSPLHCCCFDFGFSFRHLLSVISLLFVEDSLANSFSSPGILLYWFLMALWHVVSDTSCLGVLVQAISFCDFFLADILTSMVKVCITRLIDDDIKNLLYKSESGLSIPYNLLCAGLLRYGTLRVSDGPRTGWYIAQNYLSVIVMDVTAY